MTQSFKLPPHVQNDHRNILKFLSMHRNVSIILFGSFDLRYFLISQASCKG